MTNPKPNPLCQMGRCKKPDGEVRVLPYREGDFQQDWLALCEECFDWEIIFRTHEGKGGCIVFWDDIPPVTSEQIELLERGGKLK